jgi:hypothetical protein
MERIVPKGADKMKNILPVLLISLGLVACTWVKLTPEGEKVRVLSSTEVGSCKLKGQTTVALRDKVIGIERNEEKVSEELETLARNAATDLGGDTVVPASAISDGKQVFKVYKCVDPAN